MGGSEDHLESMGDERRERADRRPLNPPRMEKSDQTLFPLHRIVLNGSE